MITLHFRDSLINNKFNYQNEYYYGGLESLNIHYTKEDIEIPYILIAKDALKKAYHPDGELMFSTMERQLNGRSLTTNRLKEVLDSSRVPLIFKIGGIRYLIGKGFLAEYNSKESISVLFLATVEQGKEITSISQVKYYISRNVYLARNKKIQPVIKDFMTLHTTGDILITSNVEKYVGHHVKFPSFKSITERKKYTSSIIDQCIDEIRKAVPQKAVKLTKEQKKAKEAEILNVLRTSRDLNDSFERETPLLTGRGGFNAVSSALRDMLMRPNPLPAANVEEEVAF